MLRMHRGRSAVAGVVTAALALGGCSNGDAAPPAAAFNPQDTSISASLTWDGWAPDVNQVQNYVAEFNKTYPNIKITFKLVEYSNYGAALRPALVSGAGPDLFDLQPGALTNQYGQFATDLAPAAEKVLPGWQSKVAPVGVTGLQVGGKQAALSVGSNSAGQIWYNADQFKQFGLTPPETVADWVTDCATFKAHGTACFVQGAQDEWVDQDMVQEIADQYAPGLFTKAVEGKADWTDPMLVKAFETFHSFFSDGIMQSGAAGTKQYPDANNTWLAGKAAMVMMGSWNLQMVKSANLGPQIKAANGAGSFTALPMAFPTVPGSTAPAGAFASADYGIAVNKASKNVAAAEAFATWLTLTTAGQQFVADKLADTPSLKGIAPSADGLVTPASQTPVVTSITQQTQNATEPRSIAYADLVTALGTAFQSIATNQAGVSDALATLQQASKAVTR